MNEFKLPDNVTQQEMNEVALLSLENLCMFISKGLLNVKIINSRQTNFGETFSITFKDTISSAIKKSSNQA